MTGINERFANLDLDDDGPSGSGEEVGVSERFAGLDLDGAHNDSDVVVASVAPAPGEKVAVGGPAGWYGAGAAPVNSNGRRGRGTAIGGQGGDTFFTTARGMKTEGLDTSALTGEAIAGKNGETACQRARRLFGLDWTTRLEPATRADGGSTDRDRYFVVRNDTDEALGLVGRVAGQNGERLNPAPDILQPSALDFLDSLGFKVARGGCIGGSVPWLQGEPREVELPNGASALIHPAVTNPLDGSGSFALALPMTVIECRNFYTSVFGSRKGVKRFRHCKSSEDRMKLMKSTFEGLDGWLDKELGRMSQAWSHKVDDSWLYGEFLPRTFGYSDKSEITPKIKERMGSWLDAYFHAPAADPGFIGGAMQATSFLTSNAWNGDTGASESELLSGAAGALEARAMQSVRLVTHWPAPTL